MGVGVGVGLLGVEIGLWGLGREPGLLSEWGLGVGWRQLPDYKDLFSNLTLPPEYDVVQRPAQVTYTQLRLDGWYVCVIHCTHWLVCVCVCVIHCTHLFMLTSV